MQGETTNREMDQMRKTTLEELDKARGTIESYARENPRTAVALALGAGFVLGGGLTPRILFGLGALAARTFARDYVKNQLGSYANDLMGERAEAE